MSMRRQEEQQEQAFVALADESGAVQGWTADSSISIGPVGDLAGASVADILSEVAERWAEIWQSVVVEGKCHRLSLGRPDRAGGTVQLLDVEICKFIDQGRSLAKLEIRRSSAANAKLAVLQQEMLEAMANGLPLRELMELLCRRAEAFAPSAICSILRVDGAGRLEHLASPGLAEHYSRAIDGIAIGPKVGSCGTAAFRGEAVEVTDIATDPLWEDYRQMALPLGLRACWSSPIKSASGRVLAVFAFYFSEPRGPSALERQIVAACLHLCAIALEHEQTRQNIYQLAFRDALTHLDNRIRFQQRLDEALRLVGETKQRLAVYYIGIDRFHLINDTLGHARGDDILRATAERLTGVTKDGDILARIGGDEFAVVRIGNVKEQDIAKFARTILEAIQKPHVVQDQHLVVQASIGIALAPGDATTADELIKHAASALHRMKGRNRGLYQFYEKELDLRMRKRRKLEIDMREALEAGEFELYYQPIISAEDMKLIRAEALLRWHHRERGTIEPAEFIPIAEETGLIIPLGAQVIEQACEALADWPEDIGVAVNLSPVQFESPDLFRTISEALSKHGLLPARLQIEITESVLLADSSMNMALLDELNDLGVSIALDDFGTGYSSLSYLQRFPFDSIKIDRSFVQNICASRETLKIVRSMVMLAHSLGLRVTAEGVETDVQFAAVRGEGCDHVQGHYVAAPLPLARFQRMLAAHRPDFRQATSAP